MSLNKEQIEIVRKSRNILVHPIALLEDEIKTSNPNKSVAYSNINPVRLEELKQAFAQLNDCAKLLKTIEE